MGDKLAYYVIISVALINLMLLINSNEYTKCNRNQPTGIRATILFSLFLHYFINAFGLFGFLFDNTFILSIYLCAPIIIGVGWKVNKNDYFKSACTLTNATDLMCDVNHRHDTIKFVDFPRVLGVPDVSVGYTKTSPVYIIITVIGYITAIRKLLKKRKK